jgi:hypothetical protein
MTLNADGKPTNQDALPNGGRPSDKGGNPSQPRTYSQEEFDRMLNERHSKLDKQINDLTKERDNLKSSHDTISTQVSELQKRIDENDEAKIKDNPDLLSIHQQRKKLREDQDNFRKQRQDIDSREAGLAEREKTVQAAEWDGLVLNTANAAKGDAAVLKTKAAELGITDKDKLNALAVTLWPRKSEPPDSGNTDGSGIDWSKKSPEEKIAEGLRRQHQSK